MLDFAYDDYDLMLANPEVEAVFIATPNSLHAQQVIAAARAGKHVLCDKPMAINVPDAMQEIEECRRAGVKFGINFHNRHLVWVRDVREMIGRGVIGDIEAVEVEAGFGNPPLRQLADRSRDGRAREHLQRRGSCPRLSSIHTRFRGCRGLGHASIGNPEAEPSKGWE